MSTFDPTPGFNELAVSSMTGEIASLRKRVEELEARALLLGSDEAPPADCCTAYCCIEGSNTTLTTGQIMTLCSTDVEALGGLDLRVDVYGWVKFTANADGAVDAFVWVEVDGSTYVGAPRFAMDMKNGNFMTLPIGNSIDPSTTAPTVRARIQNLGATAIVVKQNYLRIEVGPQDGSIACGEIAGSGGPG